MTVETQALTRRRRMVEVLIFRPKVTESAEKLKKF